MLWRGAQLLFSLFISVALFSANAFGLPFAAFGLWKCGFPETIGCFQEAFLECSERKRVTLARGLASGPNVLFADEPTSGLSSTDAEMCVRRLKLQSITICPLLFQRSAPRLLRKFQRSPRGDFGFSYTTLLRMIYETSC